MELNIEKSKTLKEVIDQFNYYFPHLKFEFFSKSHNDFEPSHKKEMYKHNLTIGDIANNADNEVLIFSEDITISAFENLLKQEFGLNAQIFRRSGNVWLETTTSDHWSLKMAESEGILMDY